MRCGAEQRQQHQQGGAAVAGAAPAFADPGQAQLQVPAFQPGALVEIQGEGSGHVERFGDHHHQIPGQVGAGPLHPALLLEPDAEFHIEMPGHQGHRQYHQGRRHHVLQGEHGERQGAGALAGMAQQHGNAPGGFGALVAFQLPHAGEETAHRAQAPPGELGGQAVGAVAAEGAQQGPGARIVAEQGVAVKGQQRPLPQGLEPPEQEHRPEAAGGGAVAGQQGERQGGEHQPHQGTLAPPAPVQAGAKVHRLPAGAGRQAGVDPIQVHGASRPGTGTASTGPSRRRRRCT